jgi:hypothetical protein
MRAHDGGIDHHVLVVVITRQNLENTLKNPAFRRSIEALIDDLPSAKAPIGIFVGAQGIDVAVRG